MSESLRTGIRSRSIQRIALLALLALGVSHPAAADGQRIAIARPVSGILVDGDPSDWPSDLRRYPIAKAEFASRPRDEIDFRASFSVGFDPSENALYVLVRVRDDSTVVSTHWRDTDGCSIYLGTEADREGERRIVQFNAYGDYDDRAVTAVRDQVAAAAWNRGPEQHVYEWRFDWKALFGDGHELKDGRNAGFDVSVCDRDRDDSFSWIAWTPGIRKSEIQGRIGDLLFASSASGTGWIEGRIDAGSLRGQPFDPTLMVRREPFESSPRITIHADRQGRFRAELPEGRYQISSRADHRTEQCDVRAGKSTEIQVGLRPAPAYSRYCARDRKNIVGPGKHTASGFHFVSPDELGATEAGGVFQARSGELWIYGFRGIASFDGESFYFYGSRLLPRTPDTVSAIDMVEDLTGTFWIAAEDGLYQFREQVFTFVSGSRGIRGTLRKLVVGADGTLWVGTESSVIRLSDGLFETVVDWNHLDYRLLSFAVAPDDSIWIGTTNGLLHVAEGRTERFTSAGGLPSDRVTDVAIGHSGKKLWIGTDKGVAVREEGKFRVWPINAPTSTEKVSRIGVRSLVESPDGRVWFTFRNRSLWEIGPHGPNRLSNEGARGLCIDREGNLWVASGTVLSRVEPEHSSKLTTSKIYASARVRCLMLTSNDTAWIGTNARGLFREASGSVTNWTTSDGLPHNGVGAILEDSHGGVWVGTAAGLARITPDGSFSAFARNDELVGHNVTCLLEDRRGRIWIGSISGVSIYDGNGVSSLTSLDGLPDNHITDLCEDDRGSVWIGTVRGTARYDPIQDRVSYVAARNTLPRVECLFRRSDGSLWLGGAGGLSRFDGNKWTRLDILHDLDVVFAIAQIDEARLCLGTANGLVLYDGFAAQRVTMLDGLLPGKVAALATLSDNSVLVGANPGLNHYFARPASPPIKITRVSTVDVGDTTSVVRLDPSEFPFEIEFSSISFKTRPGSLLYRHRLVGFDEEWKLSTEPRVAYRQVPPGTYRFEVQAIDRDLEYSDSPAQVQIQVEPDYASLALWIVTASSGLLAIWLGVLLVRRERSIRRMNVELEDRVEKRTTALRREIEHSETLREQLLHTQKLEAIGTLSAGVAHDFNNVLTAILNYVHLVELSEDRTQVTRWIAGIRDAVEQASGVTSALLTFSRKTPTQRSSQRLTQVVAGASSLLDRLLPASINLQVDFAEEHPIWCQVDGPQIQQVVVNLSLNARDSMADGGTLTIAVRSFTTQDGSKRALVIVEDTGTGMSESTRGRVFEPFFTTKARGRGTGIGMAIVHGIISDHDGTVNVESELGVGTKVSIELPCCPPPSESESLSADGIEDRHSLRTILVAEDDWHVQESVCLALQNLGYSVVRASDGPEAVEFVLARHSELSAVVLDVDLPRMNGYDCLRAMRRAVPNLPAVIASSLRSSESIFELGSATVALPKPFTVIQLVRALEEALKDEITRDR